MKSEEIPQGQVLSALISKFPNTILSLLLALLLVSGNAFAHNEDRRDRDDWRRGHRGHKEKILLKAALSSTGFSPWVNG